MVSTVRVSVTQMTYMYYVYTIAYLFIMFYLFDSESYLVHFYK